MAQFIENRPVSCNMCGNYPVHGREDTYKTREATIHECRWTCHRCGSLVRVDENRIDEEKTSN